MKSFAPILLILAAQGCIEYQPGGDDADLGVPNPREIEVLKQEDKIVQVQVPEVDVLYAIDNSCSMSEEQAKLVQNFPFFMDYFLGSGLDYHIGVVSTDMVASDQSGKLRTVRGNRYIDDVTDDPVSVFAEMAVLGTGGHWEEKGREASFVALEKKKDGYNAGFLREDASLHIVAISDEEDKSTQITVSEFVQWMRQLKWSEEMVTFSSIVSEVPLCETALEPGRDYIAVTEAVGGIIWSICEDDWQEVLELLGIQASGLKREYFLSQLPVEESINVTVQEDGIVFTFKPQIDWIYLPARNSIVFNEYIPSPLAEVHVKYDVLAGEVDDAADQ